MDFFFKKILFFHGRVSIESCGSWWENTTNIFKPLKVKVNALTYVFVFLDLAFWVKLIKNQIIEIVYSVPATTVAKNQIYEV